MAPRPPQKPGQHNVGHLPGTWRRDRQGSSLAPPPNGAQHEHQGLTALTFHHKTHVVSCFHTSRLFTWTPANAARRVLLFALAGGRRLPPEAPSTNSRQPLFSRQPIMSPVHLQVAVCVLAGKLHVHMSAVIASPQWEELYTSAHSWSHKTSGEVGRQSS